MIILGILIGFYGYLFPGNINLMIMELYRSKRFSILILAALVVIICESIYCYFTLLLIDKLNEGNRWFHYLEHAAYCLSLMMGIWMILETKSKNENRNNNIYRGLISAVIHPQQIPFWFFMGVLFNNTINNSHNNFELSVFVFFNAIGVILILIVYATFGNKLLNFLNLRMSHINKFAGILYILIAVTSLLNNLIIT